MIAIILLVATVAGLYFWAKRNKSSTAKKVDSILADFTAKVEALKDAARAHRDTALDHADAAHEHDMASAAAHAEADRAENVASKISAVIA